MGCSCLLPDLARRSALSFPGIPQWAGIHCRTTVHSFMGEKLQVFQQLVDRLVRDIGDKGLRGCFRVCEDDSLLWFHLCYAGYCILEC